MIDSREQPVAAKAMQPVIGALESTLLTEAALGAADREQGTHRIRVDDAAVERVAQALYGMDNGQWVSGKGLVPGGTPWGTSREKTFRHGYRMRARAILAALTE